MCVCWIPAACRRFDLIDLISVEWKRAQSPSTGFDCKFIFDWNQS